MPAVWACSAANSGLPKLQKLRLARYPRKGLPSSSRAAGPNPRQGCLGALNLQILEYCFIRLVTSDQVPVDLGHHHRCEFFPTSQRLTRGREGRCQMADHDSSSVHRMSEPALLSTPRSWTTHPHCHRRAKKMHWTRAAVRSWRALTRSRSL